MKRDETMLYCPPRPRKKNQWGIAVCISVGVLLSACETTPNAFRSEAARGNPFTRVFPAPAAQTDNPRTGYEPSNDQTTAQDFQTQVFPATAPRVGKAVYQAGKTAGGGFNVNFSDADLQEVVQTILGDLLDQPFILDPKVQGKVTAATGGPVHRDALLSLLETTLKMNAAVMVRSGNTWRIVPIGEVSAGGETRFTGAKTPGFGITLIPLHHISANNMMLLLENTVIRAGTIKPDLVRNMLLVTGNSNERQNAVAAVSAFDVDWMSGMATGIFPLKHASATDVITELELLLQTGPGGGMEQVVRMQAIERINGILVVTPSNEILRKVQTWITRLDMGGPSDVSLRTYKIENGKALETADLLNQLFGGDVITRSRALARGVNQTNNASRRNTARQDAARRAAINRARNRGRGASAPSSAPRIIGNPINNTLAVLATQQGQKLVAQALREIDNPPAQVLIDMVIAEVTLNDTLRYGVQYFFTTNGIGNIADSGRGGFSTGKVLDANGVFPGFNFILDQGTDARFALDILDNITDLKIVSSPHIVAIDNKKAHLQVGDQVPVITRQSQDVVNPNAPLVNSVEFRDTGVILDVTPRISSTGLVTMEIRQEVSNVSTAASTGALTPTISKRLLESTVAARSGQTVLLGGLISDKQESTVAGLPGLSQTPILKHLFGGHDTTTKRTELLVFLTPRVLGVDTDISNLVEEMRQRMVLIGREADKAELAQERTNTLP